MKMLKNFWSGTYMHMDHGRLRVKKGEKVKRGQKLGLISNNMGGTPTTIHLHYDMKFGSVYVSPYMSLVDAHERLLNSIFVYPPNP